MPSSVSQGSLAAVITGATYMSVNGSYKQIKYTTEDPHNFNVGQSVTVVGIAGGTSANVTNLSIVNVPDVKSFIVSSSVAFATGTTPVIGTGSSAVTAYVTNSWASLYEIKYATAEPLTTSPYYLEISPNIQASVVNPYPTDGSVSVLLNWSAIGGSNPLATVTISQTVGTTTTVIATTAPSVSSTTITNLVADTVYTFGIVASNVYKTLPATTTQISVPKLIYSMSSVTATATANTANSITVSWVRPTVSSPLPISYEIQRASSSNNSTWSSWTTVSTSISGTTTTYVDTTVANSTYYKYQVRAFNGLYSPYLESNSLLANYITSPMVTPTLSNTSTSSTNITVAASGFVSNPAISSWKIERSTNATTWTTIATSAASLPYVDSSSLSQNTLYYYRITGSNPQITSVVSSAASLTTYATTAAPTNLSATAPKYNQVNLTWSTAVPTNPATPAIDYKIERSLTGTSGWSVVTSTATGVSYTDTTTSELTTYYYRISARNGLGYSGVSANASVATPVKEIATTTTISSNNVTWPSDLTISGTVSPAPSGGTITIRNGSTVLKSGVAVNASTGAYSTTLDLDAGTYNSLNAVYSGFDVYLTSTSDNTSGTISKADTSTSINSVGTINQGGTVTLSGSTTLGSVSVGVEVSDNAVNWSYIGAATSNSSGNWSLNYNPGTGTRYYRAYYSSSTNYNGSTSGTVSGYVRALKYGSYSNGLTQNVSGTSTTTGVNRAQGSTSNRNQVATAFTMPGDPGNGATAPVIYQLTIAFSGYGSGQTGGITPYLWNSAKGAIAGGKFTTSSAETAGINPIRSVACDLDDVGVSWSTSYWAGFIRDTSGNYYTQWGTNSNGAGNTSTTWEVGASSNSNVSNKSLIFSVQYYYYQ